MPIVYDSKLQIAKKGDKEIRFYCGDDLDEIASILLQLKFEILTTQQAYIKLIKIIKVAEISGTIVEVHNMLTNLEEYTS